MTYLWASLLLIANLLAWGTNFFTLPGNWIMLLLSALYALLLPDAADPRLSWGIVGIAAILAGLGEAWEFLAGAAGAAKQGGSRRGVVLSILGAFAGSIMGAAVGVPIPIVGPVIGALVGGALGAFAGAYGGEVWAGRRTHEQRVEIGKGAFMGRLWGTAGKLVFGILMLAILTIDSFFDV